MEPNFIKISEEILERNYDEEGNLLQNYKALMHLLKLNEEGTLTDSELLNKDQDLLFLLETGFIIKTQNNYYLSQKSIKLLRTLDIKVNTNLDRDYKIDKLFNEKIFNVYDLNILSEKVVRKNIPFNIIEGNCFIKIVKPKTIIECKLILNCIKDLNIFLSRVNGYLIENGKVIFHYQTKQQRVHYLIKNKGIAYYLINKIFSLIKYLFYNRINYTNYNYSRAELLGRMIFNDLDLVEEIKGNNYNSIIALATKKIKNNDESSKSPIIKLKRVGKSGKEILLYKFRTMYPYSEYLTDFIYQNNELQRDGKIKNDFRVVHPLGKFLRKYGLDELPMIINLLKGDLKLIGVRPLSIHYLSLYPKEFRIRRSQYKPGLIPPFYVSLPRNFSDLIKSEETYLTRYEKKPVITDFIYFMKSLYNIFFNY